MTVTTTTRATINSLIDRRDRYNQTSFVAAVVSYDRATQTATVSPQHLEVWAAEEDPVPLPDLDNVPVLFPGGGGYSITWDLAGGDFVLVVCTKYSLDVWRQRAEVSDPGDFRKFGLSGAVAHAVRMNDDAGATSEVSAGNLVIAGPGQVHLTEASPTNFLARADRVDTEIDRIWTVLTTWTVVLMDGGGALKTAAVAERGTGAPATASDKVKGV